MSPERTKNILQYDNGIMPASVKNVSYKLYIISDYMHVEWQSSFYGKTLGCVTFNAFLQSLGSSKVTYQSSSVVFDY